MYAVWTAIDRSDNWYLSTNDECQEHQRRESGWSVPGGRHVRIVKAISPNISARFWSAVENEPDELRYGAQISIWVRWMVLAGAMVEVNYRVDYGSTSHIFNMLYILAMMGINGCVYLRLRSKGKVGLGWLFALSLMDVVCIAFSTSLSGGLESRYFVLYFFSLACFAAVCTPWRLNMLWVSAVALSYVAVCVLANPGIDLAAQDEKVLFYRVGAFYAVVAMVNIVTRIERNRRQNAVERERELHRQRIEISQNIHDSTAQWAYLIGLGIEAAVDAGDQTNKEQIKRLDATAELSRYVMWELRHPIDGGQIFQGKDLNDLLRTHTSTFTAITSVPATFTHSGEEPPLSTVQRTLLFSIAHNALTNAFRHADADSVGLSVEYGEECLRMSVADDGVGLPQNFADRGHGFRNMRADAERMGGRLEVGKGPSGRGTTVTCVLPGRDFRGGD